MKFAEYIPGNPIVSFGALLDRRRIEIPAPGLFSVARFPLVYYLQYLAESRGTPVRRVFVADYMCNEVTATLRDFGFEVVFYDLDGDLDPALDRLDAMLSAAAAGPADALILTHFYGRFSRTSADVARLCASRGVTLIEDCVHVPFPYYAASREVPSQAKLYTLRKVYPIAFGAMMVVEEQQRFARFVREHVKADQSGARQEISTWLIKQIAKHLVRFAGLSPSLPYTDISLDPLKPFNFLPPVVSRLLTLRNCEDCIAIRRRNYRAYLTHAGTFERLGRILPFDLDRDIPYMFVVFLRAELNALEVVKRLKDSGVPAALGLALDQEMVRRLPPEHPLNQVVVLPVHQDIRLRHVDLIARTVGRLFSA